MTQPTNTIEVVDGYVINTVTGEVMGLAQSPIFTISDPSSLDWVLGKMLSEESAIHAIDNTEAVIHARAILDNALAMKKDRQRRLDWLHRRFDDEIGHYVRPLLEGQKTKTYKTIYGQVSFRKKPRRLAVADPESALAWASVNCPEAIKTTAEFQIGRLPADRALSLTEELLRGGDSEDSAERKAFTVIPESELVTVKTGVE